MLVGLLGAASACEGTQGTLVSSNEPILPDSGAAGVSGAASAAGASGIAGAMPLPSVDWQIQLTGELDTTVDVSFFEADLFALDPDTVGAVKTPGRTLACYVSVGTAEPWRPDYERFSEAVLGEPLVDYPQERWLDVRSDEVRAVMDDRLTRAVQLGCDAVELSNLSAHHAESGFPLTPADELDYASWLIARAHERALDAGISASDDLVPLLVDQADWGLTEECLAYDSCQVWRAFPAQGKPVFMIEYGSANNASALCPAATELGFSLVIKRRALDAFRVGCPR